MADVRACAVVDGRGWKAYMGGHVALRSTPVGSIRRHTKECRVCKSANPLAQLI